MADKKVAMALEQNAIVEEQLRDSRLFSRLMMKKAIETESELRPRQRLDQ